MVIVVVVDANFGLKHLYLLGADTLALKVLVVMQGHISSLKVVMWWTIVLLEGSVLVRGLLRVLGESLEPGV